MLRIVRIALLFFLLAPTMSRADESIIDMTASADTFAFVPDKIVAHVGRLETLRVTSVEGEHGIASDDLKIDMVRIRPNHTTTVSFTPGKVGTYVVHCAYVCGVGHSGMAFTVDVQP